MERLIDEVEPEEGAVSGGVKPSADWRKVASFGSNPGNLAMNLLVPGESRAPRPLVVVLHGCTQAVESYDRGSGWGRLARAHGFLVLMPAQKRANNVKTCFSWFEPEDTTRDRGEALSIRQMIATVAAEHAVDASRVFVCGLSAGGAMTAAMLATYPEVFASGAIIAGLPFGTASSVAEAVESMQVGRIKEARIWGDAVRAAAPPPPRWPTVAIWHGMADQVVKPINAGELVKQWTNVHGVGAAVPEENHVGRVVQRVWRDTTGRPCVSEYRVPGLGHGAPVDDAVPPAKFFLPAGLSSTLRIASDWGLVGPARRSPLSYLASLLR